MELLVVDESGKRDRRDIEIVIQMEVVIKTKVLTEVDEIVEEVAMADMNMMMEVVIERGIVIMEVEERETGSVP